MPKIDDVLDGYRLIRLIGSGGFGDVWLCQMESTGEYRALKFVPQGRIRHLNRELQALVVYRREIGRKAATHLVAIEHINRQQDGLFYVMPLADGPSELQLDAECWKPLTLATLIENRRSAGSWFSVEEVAQIFGPLALAAHTLAEAGLVHRDIKPQNILFFGEEPRLADIGLVSEDEAELSQMGTPGYVAPQWYLVTQGSPDMWGLAATLYHCATGHHPDFMSRPAYRWPPGGKEGMSAAEQKMWLLLIGIVYRATRENLAERYLQFQDMADALDALTPKRRDTVANPLETKTPKLVAGKPIPPIVHALTFGLSAFWPLYKTVRSSLQAGDQHIDSSTEPDDKSESGDV